MDVEQIARVCHEANRGYQRAVPTLGIPVAPPWDDCTHELRLSVQDGVRVVLAGATPEQSHENWCRFKREHGWVHGPHKDEALKTHPCLVPYDQLPEEQRLKDVLFTSIVRALEVARDERRPAIALGVARDGEGGAARAGACESDVPQCPALAPNVFPAPQCVKPAGHEGPHAAEDGRPTWLRSQFG